jgi:hypothetical protein
MSKETRRLIKETVKNLPCTLTGIERGKRGEELASIVQDIGNEEARQKNQKDQMKETLSALEANMRKVSSIVHSGVEYRDIKTITWMLDSNKVQIIRTDSGEIIEERDARADEMQLSLDMMKEKKDVAPAEEPADLPFADPNSLVPPPEVAEKPKKGRKPKVVDAIAKGSSVTAIDLTTFKVEKGEGKEEMTLSMSNQSVRDTSMKAGIMQLFRALGEDCENPKVLSNRIIKKYADCDQRKHILSVLNPDEFPMGIVEEKNG